MKTITFAAALGMAAALAAPASCLTATTAAATERAHPPGEVALSLINGWTNAPFSTSGAVADLIGTVVHLKGAIATAGTNPVPFTLPASMRPATDVYVKVDLCGATNGRLYIASTGVVTVQAETDFSDAQCFTSLDGAAFAIKPAGFTALTLLNGWAGSPYGTSAPAARNIGGIVQFKGAMSTSGSSTEPFILPAALRPITNVYVPVDMCGATNGRLVITPSGDVTVQAQNDFSYAQCFTSLDGVSFALPALKPLALKHGWTDTAYSTAAPALKTIGGVVHFQGAMSTSGKNANPFTLPAAFRPLTDVYVAVDLCNGNNGRLWIQPNGSVTVEAELQFSDAQCFTSLDSVSFVK